MATQQQNKQTDYSQRIGTRYLLCVATDLNTLKGLNIFSKLAVMVNLRPHIRQKEASGPVGQAEKTSSQG